MKRCSICGAPCFSGDTHAWCAVWGRNPCPACGQSTTNLRQWVRTATGRTDMEAQAATAITDPEDRADRERHIAHMRGLIAEASATLAERGVVA